MSAITEYFPRPNETCPDPGHANGNGNGKIFNLKPATDPDTLKILDARRDALAKLKTGPAAFFCKLLDLALDSRFYDDGQRGVLTYSDGAFATVFRVTVRTIYDWKTKVEAAGFVWTARTFKTNMWPMTRYYVTALHPKRQDKKTDRDGTYGTGGKPRQGPNAGQGARKPHQPSLPLPGSRQAHPRETAPPTPPVGSPEGGSDAEIVNLQGISGEGRNNLRLSAEENFGSEPQNTSAESRNNLRLPAEENFGSQPKNIAAGSRSELRPPAEADCQLKGVSEGVSSLKTAAADAVNRVNAPVGAEKKTEKTAGKGGKRLWDQIEETQLKPIDWLDRNEESEPDFLRCCREIMGKEEIDDTPGGAKGNGGLWRLNFRGKAKRGRRKDETPGQARARCWRILDEAHAKKLGGFKPDTTWAAYCMDLWIEGRV